MTLDEIISPKEYLSLFPKSKLIIYAELCQQLPEWEINTGKRIMHFMAQMAHESNQFSSFEENLNYSADRLLEVFPKYFDENSVREYASHPLKIANKIYADRFGNGDENSGDGWKYKGRGICQLTFKDNYLKYEDIINENIVQEPSLLTRTDLAVKIGCAYWEHTKYNGESLNKLADCDNLNNITKAIQGSYKFVVPRRTLYDKINRLYSGYR